jgi:hypothetical protein
MKPRYAALVLSLAPVVLSIAGCSTKAWYEGTRLSAQNECRRQPPGASEACLNRVNTMPYDDYERNRPGKQK